MRSVRRLALVLLLAGCTKDPGPAELTQLKARYQQLVLEGRRMDDPAFAELEAKLSEIPERSKAFPEAQSIRRHLHAARSGIPAQPLAVHAGAEGVVGDLERRCEALAQALPGLDGGEAELARCRHALEEARVREEHEGHGQH